MSTIIFRYSLLLSLTIVCDSNYAASAHEQEQLSLVQQQLNTIERLATQAEKANTAEPNERYRFDYFRFLLDIQRIRQGVNGYLSPSRAQARDPGELVGNYRLDPPSVEASP